MLGDTLRKDYPLLGRTLYCRIEGSGKGKKVRVVSVDINTDDDNLKLHFEHNPSSNHQAAAAIEFQRQTKKMDRLEGAKMVETGVVGSQEEAVVMVRGAGPKPSKSDPLERASRRNRAPGAGTRGPQSAGQSADITTLIRVLTAYGYTIIASPAQEKNPNAGCRRCVHSQANRANILSCASGIRVDFLPRSGFIQGKANVTAVPLIEVFATKKVAGWTFVGVGEDGTGYKHVHYHGPITEEVLKAFGIDPKGKTPDQLETGAVSLDWIRRARTAKVSVTRKSSPEDMENLKKRRASMFTE